MNKVAKNYNGANLLWQGLTGHRGWPKAWRSPTPKPRYDAVKDFFKRISAGTR